MRLVIDILFSFAERKEKSLLLLFFYLKCSILFFPVCEFRTKRIHKSSFLFLKKHILGISWNLVTLIWKLFCEMQEHWLLWLTFFKRVCHLWVYIAGMFLVWKLDWDLALYTSLHLYNTFCSGIIGGVYSRNQQDFIIVDLRK